MKIEVATTLGPIWFHGELTQFTDRPILLVVTGTFAEEDVLEHLDEIFVAHDVLRVHLPGNHCPPLIATSVGAFAAALTEAMNTLFYNRLVVAVGLSVGALVVLGLRYPGVRRNVVVEPPIFTRHLWPLAESFRDRELTPDQAEFLWNVLGIRDGDIEPRDYSALLTQLRTPTIALLGDEPLFPRRALTASPSLVDDEARALICNHRLIKYFILAGVGHNVPRQSTTAFINAIKQAVNEAGGYYGAPAT
ncbi:alpha/beta fold hydrolase [Phenylobacterium sp. J367]|uniref:alpha/beta fold hydrolase n=1 Tax=Phenylobacterium sp. J367 TaxID=2898435 RepID=UPI002150F3A9|nr:alpha/beta hydrolase [Phenylobacterium sp. J367]MCR5877532.1 hypothetical protein [Phenylobacterium sp. J367]